MWYLLGWGLVFAIVFLLVDRIYKHADLIFRIMCKTCVTTFLCACLWACIYIQNNAEEFAQHVHKVRTQL